MFVIEARAEHPEATTEKELHLMLQTLLADRFKLKVHRETVPMDGFGITVAKNGPKMKQSAADGVEKWSRVGPGLDHFDGSGEHISIARFAFILSTGVGRGPFVMRQT